MPNRAVTLLVSGEVLFVGAYLVSYFGLFIDHLDETAECVVSATFMLYGLLPMALGVFLIVAGLFALVRSKARFESTSYLSRVAVVLGIAILGFFYFRIVRR